MSFRDIFVFALLLIYPIITDASPTAGVDDLVRVPGGFFHRSNVHLVPQGGKVVHTADVTQLIDADGTVLHTAKRVQDTNSSIPLFNRPNFVSKESSNTNAKAEVRRSLLSASVSALWEATSIYDFTARWILPPLPQQGHQLLTYFPALLPPSADAFIQPVLQYGASAVGGGQYWSISSWFLDYTAGVWYYTNNTQLTETQGVQDVSPFILNNDEFGGSGSTHAWYCGFEFWQPQTGLNVQTTEDFKWAYVSMEVYNVTLVLQLPYEEPTNLENIIISTTSAGDYPSFIPWSVQNDTEDGISMVVLSSSGTGGGGLLSIRYPS